MTPEETKIWNAAVQKCAECFVGIGHRNTVLEQILPETEAERLAMECPATDKVEIIQFMLDRQKSGSKSRDEAIFEINRSNGLVDEPITEYVYGPEVPGTTTWPKRTEYETADPAEGIDWHKGVFPAIPYPDYLRRRIYRFGTQYQHDGSDVCPLADGDQPVEVAYKDGFTARYEFAENASWEEVARFTPLKGR